MDFHPGGELFYYLSQRRIISEEQAKVYMGQIILGLNYLHKNNIIYRDLKVTFFFLIDPYFLSA